MRTTQSAEVKKKPVKITLIGVNRQKRKTENKIKIKTIHFVCVRTSQLCIDVIIWILIMIEEWRTDDDDDGKNTLLQLICL